MAKAWRQEQASHVQGSKDASALSADTQSCQNHGIVNCQEGMGKEEMEAGPEDEGQRSPQQQRADGPLLLLLPPHPHFSLLTQCCDGRWSMVKAGSAEGATAER